MYNRKALINIIATKTATHISAFDCLPSIMLITEEHYLLVKDNKYVSTLRIIIEENLASPILLKE